jgi:hypothetical protein
MHEVIRLQTILASDPPTAAARSLFAWINLGIIQSLASGVMTATDAIRTFYHAENCSFVRNHMHDKLADRLMSHGVQLADLFDAMPIDEAHREFQHELEVMRGLCLELLEADRVAA